MVPSAGLLSLLELGLFPSLLINSSSAFLATLLALGQHIKKPIDSQGFRGGELWIFRYQQDDKTGLPPTAWKTRTFPPSREMKAGSLLHTTISDTLPAAGATVN